MAAIIKSHFMHYNTFSHTRLMNSYLKIYMYAHRHARACDVHFKNMCGARGTEGRVTCMMMWFLITQITGYPVIVMGLYYN